MWVIYFTLPCCILWHMEVFTGIALFSLSGRFLCYPYKYNLHRPVTYISNSDGASVELCLQYPMLKGPLQLFYILKFFTSVDVGYTNSATYFTIFEILCQYPFDIHVISVISSVIIQFQFPFLVFFCLSPPVPYSLSYGIFMSPFCPPKPTDSISCIFLFDWPTLTDPLMQSFLNISLLATAVIHINVLILFSRARVPCNIGGLTSNLRNLLFSSQVISCAIHFSPVLRSTLDSII